MRYAQGGLPMTRFTVVADNVALVSEVQAEKTIRSLQYGPSRTASPLILVRPRRVGFCLELPMLVRGCQIRVLYYLKRKACDEHGEGVVVSKQFWDARKEDFSRSFCQALDEFREQNRELRLETVGTMSRLLELAHVSAEGAAWDVHIFGVTDATIEDASDPFDYR